MSTIKNEVFGGRHLAHLTLYVSLACDNIKQLITADCRRLNVGTFALDSS